MTTRTGLVCGGAAVLAGVATLFVAGVGTAATAAGVAAVVVLGGGLAVRSGRLIDLAGAALFLGVLVAALQGASATTVLVGGGGTVLAWTFGHAAVDLRDDLGTGPSVTVESAHVAGTTALVGVAVAVTALLFRVDVPRLPPLALASVVLGAIALTAALRR
ncbi:DUF7519 family protein [Haloarcula salina]|uniref:DUF7519 family protein n=1 Tax=Haloarcula salina TaxID=1429914 RepID=UPI003C6EC19F